MLVPLENQEAVLNALGLNPRDARVQALALVAQRYNLDMLLKHVFLIQGTIYVSHAGLLHLAHTSGQLDGLEVEVVDKQDRWVATAKVWRKDMRMPFVYTDECLKNERQVNDKRKRAITRAERNALRRAFDVGVDVYDEGDIRETPVTLSSNRPELQGEGGPQVPGLDTSRSKESEPPSPSIPMEPWKALVIRCRELGMTDDERRNMVGWMTSDRTTSVKEMTPQEIGDTLTMLAGRGRPWQGNTPTTKTSTSSNPPSTSSPAPSTSPTDKPSGDAA